MVGIPLGAGDNTVGALALFYEFIFRQKFPFPLKSHVLVLISPKWQVLLATIHQIFVCLAVFLRPMAMAMATSYMSYVLHLCSTLEIVFHPSRSLNAVMFLIKIL